MSNEQSARTLRIAQVAPLWLAVPPRTYGGTELVVHLLVDELVKRGHEVTLFASGDSRSNGKLRPVCARNVFELMAGGEAWSYDYYANSAVAEALLAASEFDVIHFHTAGGQWIPFGALAQAPALFTRHEPLNLDDEWVFERYPQVPIVAISRVQVRSFVERTGRDIPVVYHGCDFALYPPCFQPGKYLAFLGRMSPNKNPLDAIRIARRASLPIVLAGEPITAEEGKYFDEQVKPLIDGKQVRHIGPVNHEQKVRFLREAAALLFPVQWAEAFGLVMIEAMACGTPVIAHNLGSVAEVVEQGTTGFHADSIDALAALVPRALALDRRGVRERAFSRFGHRRMVDDYLNLYSSLINARKPQALETSCAQYR